MTYKIPALMLIKNISNSIKSEKSLHKATVATTPSTGVVSQLWQVKNPYIAGIKKGFSETKPQAKRYGWFGVTGEYKKLVAAHKSASPTSSTSTATTNTSSVSQETYQSIETVPLRQDGISQIPLR